MTAVDVYRALWRHKWFMVLFTAAFVGAASYATSQRVKSYESSTLLRVQLRGVTPGDQLAALQTAARLSLSYAKIAESGALDNRIRALAAGRLPAGEPAHLSLSASRVEESEIFSVSVRSDDPTSSAVAANAVAPALRGLIGRRESIVEVLKPARPAASAVAPDLQLNLVLALVLGLIFNGALVLVFEFFRDRLPEPEELGETLGHPVLAIVPNLHLRKVAAATEINGEAERAESALQSSKGRPRGDDQGLEQRGERVGGS